MRFKITWHITGYGVSIPNYEGGEVVTLDEVREVVEALRIAAIDRHVLNCRFRSGYGAIDYSVGYLDECRNPACTQVRELLSKYDEVESADLKHRPAPDQGYPHVNEEG